MCLTDDMYHNLIGADIIFDDFHQKIILKLGVYTYLLFLHIAWSSQNIFIPHDAY
jgi:hypothetical protein